MLIIRIKTLYTEPPEGFVRQETLGETVSLKVAASTIRTIEYKGGLDSYLKNTKNAKLAPDARTLKRRIERWNNQLLSKPSHVLLLLQQLLSR